MAKELREWEPAASANVEQAIPSPAMDNPQVVPYSSVDAGLERGTPVWPWDSAPSLTAVPMYELFALLDHEHGEGSRS
jgi:hypothetical protein